MEKLSKKATIENMNIVIEFLLDKLKKNTKLTRKTSNEMHMIFEEIMMNIVSYAYSGSNDIGIMGSTL